MSRIAGATDDPRIGDYRRRFVPTVSTMLTSLLGLFPLIVTTPLVPDIGFLVLITWRLLRPEIWMPTSALGLGLFDDLVSGNPLGQSMMLWTLTFFLFDLLDSRVDYKDFWTDWALAAAAIIFHTAGAWYIARLMDSAVPFALMMPQIGLAILAYPMMARLVLALDRWRLAR